MSRCLRCGAESEWIEGKVKDEPSRVAELEAEVERLKAELAMAQKYIEGNSHEGAKLAVDAMRQMYDSNDALREGLRRIVNLQAEDDAGGGIATMARLRDSIIGAVALLEPKEKPCK